jgi:hypothetical protein
MFERYGSCFLCGEFIENHGGIWTGVKDCVTEFGDHLPAFPTEYRSEKFGDNLKTFILHNLSLEGFADDYFGDVETCGYFELFEEFGAILEYDERGFVYSTHYEDGIMARSEFERLMNELDDFDPEDEEPYYSEDDEY